MKKNQEIEEQEQLEVARDEGARGFAVTLQQLDEGRFHAEASEALQKLAGELSELANSYGKAKGKLTLTFSLVAEDNGTIAVDCDLKAQTPKAKRARSLFFLTKGNNLTLENPRQQKLPLRDVGGAGAARDVTAHRATKGV